MSDIQLRCTPNGHAGGQPVTVAIRPEDVALVEDGDAEAANTLEVGIEGVEFLGAHARATLVHEAFRSDPLVAQLPQTAMRRRALARGQTVRVRLPADRLRVFDAEHPHG